MRRHIPRSVLCEDALTTECGVPTQVCAAQPPHPPPRPILTLPVTVLTWPNKLSSRASLNALLTLAKVYLCAGGCRHVRSKQNTASVKHQPNVKKCWVDAELLNRYSNKLFFHNYSKYFLENIGRF